MKNKRSQLGKLTKPEKLKAKIRQINKKLRDLEKELGQQNDKRRAQ